MTQYDGSGEVRDAAGNIINVNQPGGTPTLAEVLVAGNDTGETAITMPSGIIDGTTGNGNLYMEADVAENGIAGSLELDSVANGGVATLSGGFASGIGNPGKVRTEKGSGAQAGGVVISGGNAAGGSDASGGDIALVPGLKNGAGRNGLIFLNLPTSDPGVAGALWVDGLVVKVSA